MYTTSSACEEPLPMASTLPILSTSRGLTQVLAVSFFPSLTRTRAQLTTSMADGEANRAICCCQLT